MKTWQRGENGHDGYGNERGYLYDGIWVYEFNEEVVKWNRCIYMWCVWEMWRLSSKLLWV